MFLVSYDRSKVAIPYKGACSFAFKISFLCPGVGSLYVSRSGI
jgi:hypothetical protein